MHVTECRSDSDIQRSFAVMRQLRPHLIESEYLSLIREIETQGGRLISAANGEALLGLALFRRETRLHTGSLIYVDDLVTAEEFRSRGVGRALLNWIEAFAREHSIATVALDSGVHRSAAHRFYFRQGYTIASFNFKKQSG